MNETSLTAKEYLSQAHRIDQRINAKLEQVYNLRTKATSITSVLSDISVINTPDTHPMESTIVRMIDLEREINEDIDQLVDLKRDMYDIVRSVSNPEYQLLLELRYLLFKTWPEIAASFDTEERTVFNIHGRALEEVGKILIEHAV